MARIIISLFLLTNICFAEKIGDYYSDYGFTPSIMTILKNLNHPEFINTGNPIKDRGVYIAKLALYTQSILLEMQSYQDQFMGTTGSSTWKNANKYYCKYPGSYDIDESYKAGTSDPIFSKKYIIDGISRDFFKGYLWGGNGLKENDTYDPLYGIDCSGGSFGNYNMAGFCMSIWGSANFIKEYSLYFKEVPLEKAEMGDVVWFPGHIAIVTDPIKKEITWNATTAYYNDYGPNHEKGRIFRWVSEYKKPIKYGEKLECDLSGFLFRERQYPYHNKDFCN